MMRPSEHLSMLDQSSPAPELMVRMMDQMAVNWTMAARMDGGLAWYAARSKCVFCRHEADCRTWLESPDAIPTFCPNAKFFRRCAEPMLIYAHEQPFTPHAGALR